MPPLVWLGVAICAVVAAFFVGWPAWRGYRARETRDENTERYLAWRGRADRAPRTSTREGMTNEERRRIYAGAALVGLALLALVAFFAAT